MKYADWPVRGHVTTLSKETCAVHLASGVGHSVMPESAGLSVQPLPSTGLNFLGYICSYPLPTSYCLLFIKEFVAASLPFPSPISPRAKRSETSRLKTEFGVPSQLQVLIFEVPHYNHLFSQQMSTE